MPISRPELWRIVYDHIGGVMQRAQDKTDEDLFLIPHSQNTLDWGLRIKPNAETSLKIALFGHDYGRAFSDRVRKTGRPYDIYKTEHSKQSAEKLKDVLIKFDADELLIENTFILVKFHDVLYAVPNINDRVLLENLDILRDADAFSYFDVQFDMYLKRDGVLKTAKKLKWTHDKLTPRARTRKGPKELYDKRKKELASKFEEEIKKHLRREGIVATEEYLEEAYTIFEELLTPRETELLYKNCLVRIDHAKGDMIDLL